MNALARCLIISSEFPPGPGGVGTHAYELGSNLVELGWQVRVVTRQDYANENEVAQFNASLPFRINTVAPQSNPITDLVYRLRTVTSVVREFAPDIIIATGNARIVLLALLANWRRSRPVVAIGHGTEFGAHRFSQRALTRLAYRLSNAVICVSEYTRNYMLEAGVKPKITFVVSNGANGQTFHELSGAEKEAFRASRGLNQHIVLVTIGNVSERKGQSVVIDALPGIVHEFPDVIYVAIGLPTTTQQLSRRAEEIGVSAHVRFAGRLPNDEVVKYLNIAELNIMTSRHTSTGDFEGYGIAVIEAALCGTVSVVAGNSGLAEAVDHGETGVIVPENDPEATANAILDLLRHKEKASQLANRAQSRARTEKLWSHRAREYDQILQSLIPG